MLTHSSQRRPFVVAAFLVSVLGAAFALAQETPSVTNPTPANTTGADAPLVLNDVQSLKKDVIKLNRDLFILEEELLFPANTQVVIFVSMEVGELFDLHAVELKIDDKTVASYLYTDKQVDAMYRGGVQRLYVGNVRNGEHEISAFFTGRGPSGRDFRRAASYKFDKDENAKYFELKIADSTRKHQPVFTVKEWQ